MNKILLSLIIFGNAWIWKMLSFSPIIFLTIFVTTYLLYLFIYQSFQRKFKIFLGLCLMMLLIFQFKTTTFSSLVLLDNDEQRVQQMRLGFYHPGLHYTRVIFARLNLKDFLEGDFNTISERLQRNFFETIDPNVYFFGGHPRERVWASDFEKFPFFLLAPFLVGIYVSRKKILLLGYFFASVFLLTLIGHKNPLGPFVLFPPIVIYIYSGIRKFLKL